jgi:hypothetical protein
MLIFAASDKGGTGRSVSGANVVYRQALHGTDACYLDFDFGSPTVGTIFQVESVSLGTQEGGLHDYLQGRTAMPHRVDVWAETDRRDLRDRPPKAGRLVFCPGDEWGGEFPVTDETVKRCAALFLRLEEEFDCCVFDLSAGRSYATQLALATTALAELRTVQTRWLVFHRWTRQHIVAASGLVYGSRGIIEIGTSLGHDQDLLREAIRFVRTAVVDPDGSDLAALRPAQVAWLRQCDSELTQLASRCRVGRTVLFGSVPLDPVLQWREQLITDNDVWGRGIANSQTVEAFDLLANRLTDDAAWEGL